uniref:DUF1517 domain-containing protein n=2 Tax=Gloeothece TaxID=28070 RepID=E0UJF9_GLOV7|nr:protein of unknown function DUF1517 [Gloeothece verrucosa PCC 7822]
MLKPFLKSLVVLGLILSLVLGDASSALAARTGGRIGGGSFSAPRSYSAPSGGYSSPGYGYGGGYGGYGGYGGGISFPFLLPFFGFGGFGGLFTILIFIAIANFLVRSVRNIGSSEQGLSIGSPQISVGKVQVGLLASARYLQKDLNELALRADTSTPQGRANVLQEASLALLRHPEYWVYGMTESQKTSLDSAEAKFNQWALTERSKFTQETLSNVNNLLTEGEATRPSLPEAAGQLAKLDESGEYLIATIIVGVEGQLDLPKVNDSQDLRNALQTLGGIGSDRLLAVEVLWSPQAEGDTLTSDDILAAYPNLKLV